MVQINFSVLFLFLAATVAPVAARPVNQPNRPQNNLEIHAPRPRYAINWSLLHPQTPSAPPNPIPPEHHQTPFVHQPVHQDPAPTGTHPPLPPRPFPNPLVRPKDVPKGPRDPPSKTAVQVPPNGPVPPTPPRAATTVHAPVVARPIHTIPVQVHPSGPKRTFRVMNPDTEEKLSPSPGPTPAKTSVQVLPVPPNPQAATVHTPVVARPVHTAPVHVHPGGPKRTLSVMNPDTNPLSPPGPTPARPPSVPPNPPVPPKNTGNHYEASVYKAYFGPPDVPPKPAPPPTNDHYEASVYKAYFDPK